jgi:hypothetical protein
MREPRNLRENQSLKAQGLEYRFPKIIGGELGEISGEWETHTVEYKPEWDAYGFNLTEMAVKGSGIPAPLIYRVQGETLTELQELPLSTIPPVSFYCIDYHGTGFESTSRVYMHEDTNGWTILVKRYAGLGRVPQHPRKTGFVFNALKIGGSVIGNEAAYAGGTIAREQLALKEIITEDVHRRFNVIEHGITNGKSRIVSWSSHYRPQSAKFRDVSFLSYPLDGSKWYGTAALGGSAQVLDNNGSAASFLDIAYGNGVWVAVAASIAGGTSVYSSPNGITWTQRTAAQTNNWAGVAYGNGWFVAVSINGSSRVMRSQDGISWAAASAAEANGWRSVSYGNGKFIAVSNTGSNRAMISSDDGATWTPSNIGARSWLSIEYGSGVWVANSASEIKRSTDDGATWIDELSTAPIQPRGRAAYGNGGWVLSAYDYGLSQVRVYTSTDGASWTLSAAVTSGSVGDYHALAFGNGLHALVTEGGGAYISTDAGASWTPYPGPLDNVGTSGTFGQPVSMAFGQSQFSMVCNSGVTGWSERKFADDETLSFITDIDDEASPSDREVYTYILYKQAGA